MEWRGGRSLGAQLALAVSGAGALGHLGVLQRIAERHGGNRAAGTPGFAASRDYVADALAAAGYQVTRQDAPYTCFVVTQESTRLAGPQDMNLGTLLMDQSPPLREQAIPLVTLLGAGTATEGNGSGQNGSDGSPAPDGSQPGDYSDCAARGAVVLLARAPGGYARQLAAAAAAGARAVLLYTVTPSPDNIYRLHWYEPGPPPIPLASITQNTATRLAGLVRRGPVWLRLDWAGTAAGGVSQNIIAETDGGEPGRVVVAGAHLDSVADGPGLNDNGSGAAAILQTAIKLGAAQGAVRNKVRFAFWAAEELVNSGSGHYVASLTAAQRRAIGIYLNAEMIASHNFTRFVMRGSGAVTEPFDTYFRRGGLGYDYIDAGQVGSDHEPFRAAGIPVGGLFGGALTVKTAAQARRYGGAAGELHDPYYHQPGDTVQHISQAALDQSTRALAYAIGTAAEQDGPLPAEQSA